MVLKSITVYSLVSMKEFIAIIIIQLYSGTSINPPTQTLTSIPIINQLLSSYSNHVRNKAAIIIIY